MSGFLDNYKPNFIPEKFDLNEVLPNLEQEVQAVAEKTVLTIDEAVTNDPAVANLTNELVVQLRDDIKRVKKKAADTRIDLLNYLNKSGATKKLVMDIKDNPFLKRLVKKAFGIKSDVITYEMYLEAVAAKKQMESEDVKEYAKGNLIAKK